MGNVFIGKKKRIILMFCFLLFGQGLCKTDVQGRCKKDRTWCVVGCCVAWGCDVGMEVMHTDESLKIFSIFDRIVEI